MYYRYLIKKELEGVGFQDIKIMTYIKIVNQIPNFNSYYLDSKEDGFSYKGFSSLYFEAKK